MEVLLKATAAVVDCSVELLHKRKLRVTSISRPIRPPASRFDRNGMVLTVLVVLTMLTTSPVRYHNHTQDGQVVPPQQSLETRVVARAR